MDGQGMTLNARTIERPNENKRDADRNGQLTTEGKYADVRTRGFKVILCFV